MLFTKIRKLPFTMQEVVQTSFIKGQFPLVLVVPADVAASGVDGWLVLPRLVMSHLHLLKFGPSLPYEKAGHSHI